MSVSGRETLPVVCEWSGDPPGCPAIVGRPSQMSGSVRKAFPVVQEWSGCSPASLGVVGRPYRMSGSLFRMTGSGRLALPNVWEWL